MGGDLDDVFGGVGGGGGEVGNYGFVEGFAFGINDLSEAGLRGGEGVAEVQEGFGDGAGFGAGEADDAYASSAGWGGDGYYGVVVEVGGGHFSLLFQGYRGGIFLVMREGGFWRFWCVVRGFLWSVDGEMCGKCGLRTATF